jgi:hypothetical protein
MNTYTKLRDGTWGIRGEDIKRGTEGCTVVVTKRDGSEKPETIGKVLWRGNGVGIATIRRDNDQPRRRYANEECPVCGEYEAWESGCNHPWHDRH